jgi:hypothetical protein
LWIGIFPRTMAGLAFSSGAYLSHMDITTLDMGHIFYPLSFIINGIFIFILLAAFLAGIRRILFNGMTMPVKGTWICGFTQVTAKFQYTSSSFARPIVDFVKNILFFRREGGEVIGGFPQKTSMSSSIRDAAEEFLFKPLYRRLTILSKRLDINRIRYTQMYLMYILLYLIFLLAWKMK